jgi:hypothetical protein
VQPNPGIGRACNNADLTRPDRRNGRSWMDESLPVNPQREATKVGHSRLAHGVPVRWRGTCGRERDSVSRVHSADWPVFRSRRRARLPSGPVKSEDTTVSLRLFLDCGVAVMKYASIPWARTASKTFAARKNTGFFAWILESLHHSRRLQAQRFLRSHRHLIAGGPDSGLKPNVGDGEHGDR